MKKLEYYFSNIERIQTCSSIGDQIQTSYFGFEQTNIEPNRAFTRFTKLLIELTRTSFFQIQKELEHVHLLIIELEHPISGFKRSNIDHRT